MRLANTITRLHLGRFITPRVVGGRILCLPFSSSDLLPKDGEIMTHPGFKIVEEKEVYSRYFSVFDRKIQYPEKDGEPGPVYDFDVVGHPKANYHFAVVLPFHPYTDGRKGGEVTVVREFSHGLMSLLYTLPAGCFDPVKHENYIQCAKAELEEEAQLEGGELIPLVSLQHAGLPEVKWCANRFHPFLCINPQAVSAPRKQDAEEFIEVFRVDLQELKEVALSGNMMLPSITTMFMAIDKLQQLGYC